MENTTMTEISEEAIDVMHDALYGQDPADRIVCKNTLKTVLPFLAPRPVVTLAQLELACAASWDQKRERSGGPLWKELPDCDFKEEERADLRAALRVAGLEVEGPEAAPAQSKEWEELLVSGIDLTEDRHRAAIEACKKAAAVLEIYASPAITDAFQALATWLEDGR